MVLATIDSQYAVLERGGRCPWYAGRAGSSWSFARCVQRQGPSAAAVHQHARLHPRRGAEAFPWSRLFVRPSGFPSCFTRTVRAKFPCRGAEADSHGLLNSKATETPQLRVDKVVDAPICRSCTSSFSCRDAEADPHGLVDHGDYPVFSSTIPAPCVDRFMRNEARSQLLVGSCAQAQGHDFPRH